MTPRRILITGCSTGFGRGAAERLAALGHEVVATARDPQSLADLPVAERLALDVCDDASVKAACAAAGPVDALVNNAGINVAGPIEGVPLDQMRRVFETNFFGAVRMIQALAPAMRERGSGVIVNVSSISGRVTSPLNGVYAASKYALEAVSEALHYELGHFGVRTVLIEPGYFMTSMRDRTLHIADDGPPYDELLRQWEGNDERLVGGERPGPEAVVEAIVSAVREPGPPLRRPVGKDAEMVLGARSSMDDEQFEASMRAFLKLDW